MSAEPATPEGILVVRDVAELGGVRPATVWSYVKESKKTVGVRPGRYVDDPFPAPDGYLNGASPRPGSFLLLADITRILNEERAQRGEGPLGPFSARSYLKEGRIDGGRYVGNPLPQPVGHMGSGGHMPWWEPGQEKAVRDWVRGLTSMGAGTSTRQRVEGRNWPWWDEAEQRGPIIEWFARHRRG